MILAILFGALALGVTIGFAVILGKRRRVINAEVAAFRKQLDDCKDVAGAAKAEQS